MSKKLRKIMVGELCLRKGLYLLKQLIYLCSVTSVDVLIEILHGLI